MVLLRAQGLKTSLLCLRNFLLIKSVRQLVITSHFQSCTHSCQNTHTRSNKRFSADPTVLAKEQLSAPLMSWARLSRLCHEKTEENPSILTFSQKVFRVPFYDCRDHSLFPCTLTRNPSTILVHQNLSSKRISTDSICARSEILLIAHLNSCLYKSPHQQEHCTKIQILCVSNDQNTSSCFSFILSGRNTCVLSVGVRWNNLEAL